MIIQNNLTNLLTNVNIDPQLLQRNKDGNFIITNEEDKQNVIGANFAAVYTQNKNLGKQRLSEMIERHYDNAVDDLDTGTSLDASLVIFSDRNVASDPHWDTDTKYFHTPLETLRLFRSLNNKKSSGTDGIPNVVLKRLPFRIIYDYNILFNNCLNNCYFPEA